MTQEFLDRFFLSRGKDGFRRLRLGLLDLGGGRRSQSRRGRGSRSRGRLLYGFFKIQG